MKDENYLKRKLKNNVDIFYKVFDLDDVYRIREGFKLGILTDDVGYGKIGNLCLFKRQKEYIEENINGYEYPSPGGWTGNFEWIYITADKQYRKYNTRYDLVAKELI